MSEKKGNEDKVILSISKKGIRSKTVSLKSINSIQKKKFTKEKELEISDKLGNILTELENTRKELSDYFEQGGAIDSSIEEIEMDLQDFREKFLRRPEEVKVPKSYERAKDIIFPMNFKFDLRITKAMTYVFTKTFKFELKNVIRNRGTSDQNPHYIFDLYVDGTLIAQQKPLFAVNKKAIKERLLQDIRIEFRGYTEKPLKGLKQHKVDLIKGQIGRKLPVNINAITPKEGLKR